MKYNIFRTNSFKKGFKKLSSNHQDLVLEVVGKLANGIALEKNHKDHLLSGNFRSC